MYIKNKEIVNKEKKLGELFKEVQYSNNRSFRKMNRENKGKEITK